MATVMSAYIEYLRDSSLVWSFQSYFGVVKLTKAATHSNGYEPSDSAVVEKNAETHARSRTKAETTLSSDETLSESDSGDGLYGEQSYMITNKFWYHLFCFGTALGDENFYTSFFPFWFWNIDGAVGRRVVMIWVIIMYIGQGLKDIICWPRPFSPPAVKLEKKWALEFGMPSTHAMVGLGVPFTILYYTMYRYEYPVFLGFILCLAWCVVVCLSRIYLGMHTVLDIIGGLLLTVILLALFLPFLDHLDHFQLTNSYSPIIIVGSILFLVIFYPSGPIWTPARGDTTIILGVGAGCSFGSWLNYKLKIIHGPPIPPPYKILWPTYEMVGLTLLRSCIGILIVVGTRAFFKSISYILVCWIFRLDPKDKENNQKTFVELSCKFITYAVIGFNVSYLSPAVFRFLTIERATMYTEV
uniref:Phosphatidic acid phosphatase type 2/haloperoxidase domain-containing protein n=1 Tax=Strigamia maritima TaxID=126957 RepID=T1ISK6_STRMM